VLVSVGETGGGKEEKGAEEGAEVLPLEEKLGLEGGVQEVRKEEVLATERNVSKERAVVDEIEDADEGCDTSEVEQSESEMNEVFEVAREILEDTLPEQRVRLDIRHVCPHLGRCWRFVSSIAAVKALF
jgi:hypothetical protein